MSFSNSIISHFILPIFASVSVATKFNLCHVSTSFGHLVENPFGQMKPMFEWIFNHKNKWQRSEISRRRPLFSGPTKMLIILTTNFDISMTLPRFFFHFRLTIIDTWNSVENLYSVYTLCFRLTSLVAVWMEASTWNGK